MRCPEPSNQETMNTPGPEGEDRTLMQDRIEVGSHGTQCCPTEVLVKKGSSHFQNNTKKVTEGEGINMLFFSFHPLLFCWYFSLAKSTRIQRASSLLGLASQGKSRTEKGGEWNSGSRKWEKRETPA